MNVKTTTAACLLSLVATAGTAAAQSFEGTIQQRTLTIQDEALYELFWSEDEEEPQYDSEEAYNEAMAEKLFALPIEELEALAAQGRADLSESTVYIRGSLIRIGTAEDEGFTIMDMESGDLWMVSPAERSYVQYSKADQEETEQKANALLARMGIDPSAMAEDEGEEEERAPPQVTALGERRVINGFDARGVSGQDGEEFAIAWCAEGEGALGRALRQLVQDSEEWGDEEDGGPALEDAMCGDALPVLTRSFQPYPGVFELEEVLAVDQGTLAAGLFEIPEGYEKVDLSALWR